jgi:hypothetical protein
MIFGSMPSTLPVRYCIAALTSVLGATPDLTRRANFSSAGFLGFNAAI